GLHWPAGLAITGIWLLVALVFRYSSLSALTAFALAPAVFYWLMPEPPVVIAMLVLAVMLFWRHRTNIADLLSGREGKITFGKKQDL
ncbi:MAG: glycerol-3-phosphate acyltransferase, partial [Gammaproteobacteria bacterium]|nr:glycerol-3-phosphate acyltransferase [Gammaproteobacteria bacterium]